MERELLGLTVHELIYSDTSWPSMYLDIQRLNRRVTNLLSAGRLYVDQLMHDAGDLDSTDSSLVERLKTKCSEQYDSKLGYRVMEALRNYTQHRALPVHRLSYPAAWEPPEVTKHLVYRIVPSIAVEELRKDNRVKKAVIKELEAISHSVPVTPLVREYVEGLSVVHGAFREFVLPDLARWEAALEWVWSHYKEASGDARRVVRLVAINEEGKYTDSDDIFEDLIEHRKGLANKNPILTNLALRFVSGACELREG